MNKQKINSIVKHLRKIAEKSDRKLSEKINLNSKLVDLYDILPHIKDMSITMGKIMLDVYTGTSLIVPQLECKKCGTRWFPRVLNGEIIMPKTCSNGECNSPNWWKKDHGSKRT